VTASVTIRLSTGGKLLAFPRRIRLAEGMRIQRWDPGDTATDWDGDRIRERAGVLLQAGYLRGYAVAAIADATGEMAALTEMAIDPEHPEWAHQQLTAVTRPHRGHRLGLLVKSVMLEWLASAEPRVERVATGNAASNEHMIAVNEALGYEVVEPGYRHCELAVAGVR
jgi:RimJ/RimL family protein N-acetyltransferase